MISDFSTSAVLSMVRDHLKRSLDTFQRGLINQWYWRANSYRWIYRMIDLRRPCDINRKQNSVEDDLLIGNRELAWISLHLLTIKREIDLFRCFALTMIIRWLLYRPYRFYIQRYLLVSDNQTVTKCQPCYT